MCVRACRRVHVVLSYLCSSPVPKSDARKATNRVLVNGEALLAIVFPSRGGSTCAVHVLALQSRLSSPRAHNIKRSIVFPFLLVFPSRTTDGVITVSKDWNLPKHAQINVPNIQVMKLMQSFASRNLCKMNYTWGWFYYTLTDEGITYLREYLHAPEDVVPLTLKKSAEPQAPASFGQAARGERTGFDGARRGRGRGGYRGGEGREGGATRDFDGEGARRGGRGGFRGGRGGFRGGRGGEGSGETSTAAQ